MVFEFIVSIFLKGKTNYFKDKLDTLLDCIYNNFFIQLGWFFDSF